MGSPSVLDLESLCLPVSDDSYTGEDLRQDLSPTPVYYQVKDARSAARAAERQGEFEPVIGALEANAWRPVLELGTEVLATRSKDLELCAWMIEALVRTDGFAGLRDGLRLARRLVESSWEGIYPLPDEDGVETTVAALTGLNGAGAEGTLTAPIARIPITQGSSIEPVATWTCKQAYDLERLEDEARQERIAAGAISNQDVQTTVHETPVEFFVDLIDDLGECLEELAALGTTLDELCGSDSPPTSSIREALVEALDTVRLIAGHVLPEPAAEVEEALDDAQDGGDAPAAAGAAQSAPGTIQTREDAFRTLALVADYFRRSEPHSPISFLVERAVRWGKLPLPELLSELIPDESARDTYALLTGVQPPSEYEESSYSDE